MLASASDDTMGDVINLNRHRKAARKKAEEAAADTNAIRHGRTKAERRRVKDEERRAAEQHEDRRLEGAPGSGTADTADTAETAEPADPDGDASP